MSFQAYLDTIKEKTGNTPEDFKKLAKKAKIIHDDMKATELVDWLKKEFDLGHGHCMALWNVFVTSGWVNTKNSKMTKKK